MLFQKTAGGLKDILCFMKKLKDHAQKKLYIHGGLGFISGLNMFYWIFILEKKIAHGSTM